MRAVSLAGDDEAADRPAAGRGGAVVVLVRVVAGVLLLAHGLVHLIYLAGDVPEFSLDRSWLVPDAARRLLGLGLVVATTVAFAILALAVWGVPGISTVWPAVAVLACLLSLVLLSLFWSRQLMFGVAIDVALVAVAVTRPGFLEGFLP
jgi:hypothetical protein